MTKRNNTTSQSSKGKKASKKGDVSTSRLSLASSTSPDTLTTIAPEQLAVFQDLLKQKGQTKSAQNTLNKAKKLEENRHKIFCFRILGINQIII